MDGIKIQKTTASLLLCLALIAGAALVWGGAVKDGAVPEAKAVDEVKQGADVAPANGSAVQDVYLTATRDGYDKSEIIVRKGVPVRFHFTAIDAGCGSYLVLYGLDVGILSKGNQEAVAEFTPGEEGTYEYNCGMRMYPPGRFVVGS